MKNLGDQWVETIDGVEHMVKAVMPSHLKIDLKASCHHCFYVAPSPMCDCRYNGKDCPVDNENSLIVKDLGILRNGKLPSSFGAYPTTQAPSEVHEDWFLYAWLAENGEIIRKEWAFGKTEQQAIDAWNRRVYDGMRFSKRHKSSH